MPKFMSSNFINRVTKKGMRGYPFFYLVTTFISLLSIDVLYRYFNHGIVADPDLVHIIFIDLFLSCLIMTFLVIIPKQVRKHTLFLIILVFSSMAFLYTTLRFEGILKSTLIDIRVLYDLGVRIGNEFRLLYLLFFTPLLFTFIPVKLRYTKVKYSGLVLLLIVSGVVGTVYLQTEKYNSRIETTTNLDKLIYNDEENVIFARLGVNAGFIRSAISYDEYNLDEINLLNSVNYYLTDDVSSNQYSSIFRNKNLIVIEVENLDYMAVTEEVMPITYSLMHTGLNFSNYYEEGYVNGNNFEFYTGIYESSNTVNSVATFSNNNYPYALANQFRNNFYSTSLIKSEENEYLFDDNFEKSIGFRNIYDNTNLSGTITNDYDLAVEGSKEFIEDDFFFANIKFNGLSDQPTSISADGETFDELNIPQSLRNYYSKANEIDNAINYLLQQVVSSGGLQRTVIMITSTGHPDYFEDDFIRNHSINRLGLNINRVPFIVWDSVSKETITESMASINVAPTIANMFDFNGVQEYVGDDLFAQGNNIVAFNSRSWISNAGYYDSYRQEFFVADKVYLTDYLDEYIYITNGKVYDMFLYSRIILEKNYFIQVNI